MTTTQRTFLFTLVGGAAAAIHRAAGQGQPAHGQDDDLSAARGPKVAKAQRAEKPLRILILGGTGFIGPHLVENARARGHTITLFNRGKHHTELFPDLEKRRGDRDGKRDTLMGLSWDAVIDTSGYVPQLVKSPA